MTALFIPGIPGDAHDIERAYVEIRRQTAGGDGVHERLGCSAYSVLEFDP